MSYNSYFNFFYQPLDLTAECVLLLDDNLTYFSDILKWLHPSLKTTPFCCNQPHLSGWYGHHLDRHWSNQFDSNSYLNWPDWWVTMEQRSPFQVPPEQILMKIPLNFVQGKPVSILGCTFCLAWIPSDWFQQLRNWQIHYHISTQSLVNVFWWLEHTGMGI